MVDEIVEAILSKVDVKITEAIGKIKPCECKPPSEPVKEEHLVLVADQSAAYWPRLKGEYERAKGSYSAFKVAPPPSFSVQLPQLVLYRNNNPVKQIVGLQDVSQTLNSLYRGGKL